MSWACTYVESLACGEPISLQNKDFIKQIAFSDCSLVTIYPVDDFLPKVGDFILCKVKGSFGLRKVKALQDNFITVCDGNNRVGGRITHSKILGKCLIGNK